MHWALRFVLAVLLFALGYEGIELVEVIKAMVDIGELASWTLWVSSLLVASVLGTSLVLSIENL